MKRQHNSSASNSPSECELKSDFLSIKKTIKIRFKFPRIKTSSLQFTYSQQTGRKRHGNAQQRSTSKDTEVDHKFG